MLYRPLEFRHASKAVDLQQLHFQEYLDLRMNEVIAGPSRVSVPLAQTYNMSLMLHNYRTAHKEHLMPVTLDQHCQ